jgi:exodeoxyribonuclease VIII
MDNKILATDVAPDLETMGRDNNAIITSIGAASWNKDEEIITSSFHVVLDWKKAMEEHPGVFSTTEATIQFWSEQSEDAKTELNGTMPLEEGLKLFRDWWLENCDPNTKIWGNGVEFDVIILEYAMSYFGIEIPWTFRDREHMRTIVNIGKYYLGINPKEDLPFEGELHVSVDDAIHQAKVILEIQKELKRKYVM